MDDSSFTDYSLSEGTSPGTDGSESEAFLIESEG